MKLIIILTLLIVTGCSKSGDFGDKIGKPIHSEKEKPVIADVEPDEHSYIDEEYNEVTVQDDKVVIFSEQLSNIKNIGLEITNAFKVLASHKTIRMRRNVCYNDARKNVNLFAFFCFNQNSYNASPMKIYYPSSGFQEIPYAFLETTSRVWTPWKLVEFEDDLTLRDLGIEVYINDRFVDISSKDISIDPDSAKVLSLKVELNFEQEETGNLKIVAEPVYETKVIEMGHVSPKLYSCKIDKFSKLTAYVTSPSFISNGMCLDRENNNKNYLWFEGSMATKVESSSSKNKFDLKVRIKALRDIENEN